MCAWMRAWTHAWTHACQSIPFCTVQDPLPGNDPLTMNVPSHINEHSQDNPPQTCPEPRLSSDFPCQADNEHWPSEPPFWHSILGVFISAGFFSTFFIFGFILLGAHWFLILFIIHSFIIFIDFIKFYIFDTFHLNAAVWFIEIVNNI